MGLALGRQAALVEAGISGLPGYCRVPPGSTVIATLGLYCG
jgi:hypothetical protein